MVAEPWLVRLGNQMSSKHSNQSKNNKHEANRAVERIGILSFEVANMLPRTVHLHQTLVSSDEMYLLELAVSEKLEDLNIIAGVVSRLGRKWILVKDMEAMVRRMERFVYTIVSL
ncbi:hypothetical protein Hdeb2414_s0019g00546051 [Helianthus debilis subsp. tardiflorus]